MWKNILKIRSFAEALLACRVMFVCQTFRSGTLVTPWTVMRVHVKIHIFHDHVLNVKLKFPHKSN